MHKGHGYRAAIPRYCSIDYPYSKGAAAQWAFYGVVGYSGHTVTFPYPGQRNFSIAFSDATCEWTWVFLLTGDDGNAYGLEVKFRPLFTGPGSVFFHSMTDAFGSTFIAQTNCPKPSPFFWDGEIVTQLTSAVVVTGAFEDHFTFNRRPIPYSEE